MADPSNLVVGPDPPAQGESTFSMSPKKAPYPAATAAFADLSNPSADCTTVIWALLSVATKSTATGSRAGWSDSPERVSRVGRCTSVNSPTHCVRLQSRRCMVAFQARPARTSISTSSAEIAAVPNQTANLAGNVQASKTCNGSAQKAPVKRTELLTEILLFYLYPFQRLREGLSIPPETDDPVSGSGAMCGEISCPGPRGVEVHRRDTRPFTSSLAGNARQLNLQQSRPCGPQN